MDLETNIIRIPISEKLRNYIERATYIRNRYTAFTSLISSDWKSYMTNEEFESSFAWLNAECENAKEGLRMILNSVEKIYMNDIQRRVFDVDFINSQIVIYAGEDRSFSLSKYIRDSHKNNSESYNDMIQRIFDNESISINDGTHVMSITLQVTDACNMACTYCYQHNKGHHSMDFNTAKKFIDMLFEGDNKTTNYMDINKISGIILDFIGGEPFLEVELVDKVCNYFCAQLFKRKHKLLTRFMFSFSSNGLLYFDPKVQSYINKYSGLTSIGISIDGNKELHDACRVDLNGEGTYDRAIKAAKDLMSKHGGEDTKMTISPNNVQYIYDALVNMIELGFRVIHLNCVYEEGWTEEHAKILYDNLIKIIKYLDENNLLEKVNISMLGEMYCKPLSPDSNNNWCGGAGLMLALDWKGDCYPCLRYMESSVGDKQIPYIIGNINDGLCNLHDHKERLDCMKCVTRRSQSTDECFNCPIASGCGWCSAYNYECFGTVNKRATYTCVMHKARSLANAYYLKMRYNRQTMVHCPEEWAVPIIGQEEYNWLKEFCEKK